MSIPESTPTHLPWATLCQNRLFIPQSGTLDLASAILLRLVNTFTQILLLLITKTDVKDVKTCTVYKLLFLLCSPNNSAILIFQRLLPRGTLQCRLCFASADGNYHITTMTKATLYHHGLVKWEPPAIFKSSCDIDVRYWEPYPLYHIYQFFFCLENLYIYIIYRCLRFKKSM